MFALFLLVGLAAFLYCRFGVRSKSETVIGQQFGDVHFQRDHDTSERNALYVGRVEVEYVPVEVKCRHGKSLSLGSQLPTNVGDQVDTLESFCMKITLVLDFLFLPQGHSVNADFCRKLGRNLTEIKMVADVRFEIGHGRGAGFSGGMAD